MSWQPHGVFAPPPPGATGVPQIQPGQQQLPAQYPLGGYSVDHLPPPPSQPWGQPQQQPWQQPPGVQPGVPGAQIAQPWQGAPPQGWNPQGQPQQQPPSQPQGWPQAPAQPPQQPNAAELSDNTILQGPAVPPELRGRTWGEARRLYSALSTDWLQRNRQPQTPAQQTLASQPAQQPQPTQSPSAPQDPRQFWSNPEQRIADIVTQTVSQQLQPVMQRTQQAGILEAREIAAKGIPDFQYLEPDIMQLVAGATPDYLQRPETWVAAARMARGMRVEQGQYQPPRPSQEPPRLPGSNGASAQPSWTPAPPVGSFFTESPSAPSVGGGYGSQGARTPTQDDVFYAQKWGMELPQFMAWKYGQAPQVMGSF